MFECSGPQLLRTPSPESDTPFVSSRSSILTTTGGRSHSTHFTDDETKSLTQKHMAHKGQSRIQARAPNTQLRRNRDGATLV